MKEKDFIYIEFTGRAKDTQEVFDTSDEETAKKANLYDEKINYGTIPIVIGAHQVIEGLEEVLKEMNVGEKKTVDISSEKAFGERNSALVQLLPMSIFKENGISPSLDRVVDFNGVKGKILSIDGGRVKVDFNHPLAGKIIEYDVEIKGQITDTDEKIKSIVRYFTGMKYDDIHTRLNGNEVTINIKKYDMPKRVKQNISNTIFKWMDGIAKVTFTDVFEPN